MLNQEIELRGKFMSFLIGQKVRVDRLWIKNEAIINSESYTGDVLDYDKKTDTTIIKSDKDNSIKSEQNARIADLKNKCDIETKITKI